MDNIISFEDFSINEDTTPPNNEAISYPDNLITNEWEHFDGDTLPQVAIDWMNKKDAWRGGNEWSDAYYKGDLETTNDWVIITPDGGFYKVNAKVMIWHNGGSKAAFSQESMINMLNAIFAGKPIPQDPDYES